MKTNAPRMIAGIALIAVAFGLGYYVALPDGLPADADASEVSSAVRTALATPNELERAAGLAPILASLDARNLDAVVGAYEATFTNVGPGTVAIEMLGEAWSKIDPAGALQRIQGWKPYRQSTALPPLMRSWARRDPAAARAAVAKIEPAKLRDDATKAVIIGWADSGDPALWDAYIAGLPFGREAAYDLMQRIGAREGIDALLLRAESLPEDGPAGFRNLALVHAVDIAARTDPERAAVFVEQHSESVGGLAGTVTARWAVSDGPRATEWALSRPTDSARNRALRAAFENWLWSDQQAALDWVQHQPEEVAAGVLDIYATAIGRTDPKRALEISAGIADPTVKRQAQMRFARDWLALQPKIALSWLQEHDLADLVAEHRPDGAQVPSRPVEQREGGNGD